jgi:prevent-host-death family protein
MFLTNLTKSAVGFTGQESTVASSQVNLYEAKTQLSSLVERAAKGEEIVIAKAGKPMARLTAVVDEEKAPVPLRKFGQDLLGITFLSEDWENNIPLSYFEDEGKPNPFGSEPAEIGPK